MSACPTGSLIELSPAALFRERPEPASAAAPRLPPGPARARRTRLDILPAAPFIDGIAVRDSGAARVRTRKLSRLIWGLGLGAFAGVLAEVALRWFRADLVGQLPPDARSTASSRRSPR